MSQNQGFIVSRGAGNWHVTEYPDGKFIAALTNSLAYVARNVVPGSPDGDITPTQPIAVALRQREDFRDLVVFLIERQAWISPRIYRALLGGTITACGSALIAAGTMAYFKPSFLAADLHFAAGAVVVAIPALLNRFRKA